MKYIDCLPHVLPYVAGCPEEVAISALRNAAIEFCKETQCHITGVSVVFDGATGPVPDLATQIVDIVDAKCAGQPLKVLALNDPEVEELGMGEFAIRMADPNSLTITPTPTVPMRVDLLAIVAPGPASTQMLDDLWRRHHEAIANGALHRIFEIPSRVWSDGQLAIYYGNKFEAAKAKAKADAHKNHAKPARRLRVAAV